MSFMDKVKQQATTLAAQAQQGVAQGQAKLDQLQVKRAADAALRDLGAAYYAEQRTGGSPGAVAAALAALDAHTALHGRLDTSPTPPAGPGTEPQPGTPEPGPGL